MYRRNSFDSKFSCKNLLISSVKIVLAVEIVARLRKWSKCRWNLSGESWLLSWLLDKLVRSRLILFFFWTFALTCTFFGFVCSISLDCCFGFGWNAACSSRCFDCFWNPYSLRGEFFARVSLLTADHDGTNPVTLISGLQIFRFATS